MASLKEKLVEDMKLAMKNKNEKKVAVIRMIRAAIKNEEIKKRKELNDEEVIKVMVKEIQQHQESIARYDNFNKTETVVRLKKEIEIIADYLPQTVTNEL